MLSERRQVLCVLAVTFIFITLIRTVLSLLRKRCSRTLIEKGQSATVCAKQCILRVGGLF